MIIGIGVDIADYERMRTAIQRSGQPLLNRIYTDAEQERCRSRRDPTPCFASRFAAKEALAKALQLGIARMGMTNAEVCNRNNGAPFFRLRGKLARWADRQAGLTIHLSLSDGQTHAIAMVLIEAEAAITLPHTL